jgi:hypothetical protein
MADKDFKVKNGIDVAGNANIDGNLNAAKYQDSAPSSPVNGQIWIDSNATASVINTNDFLLKADATSIYETQTDAASTYAPLASPTFTGTVVLPSTTSIGTVTSTEIGYVDGVTSAIQTQLDAKAPIANPTFTGTVNTAAITATGAIRADSGGADGGFTLRPWTSGSSYESLATSNMTSTEYVVLSDGTTTFIGAGSGGATYIRGGSNNSTNEIVVSDSTATIRGGRLAGVSGGQGTTTSGANLTVTHGLGITPTTAVATVRSNTYSATNNTNIFVGNLGATTFTVFANNGASGAVAAAFSWMVCA